MVVLDRPPLPSDPTPPDLSDRVLLINQALLDIHDNCPSCLGLTAFSNLTRTKSSSMRSPVLSMLRRSPATPPVTSSTFPGHRICTSPSTCATPVATGETRICFWEVARSHQSWRNQPQQHNKTASGASPRLPAQVDRVESNGFLSAAAWDRSRSAWSTVSTR
jgi:hypothetical protein